MEPLTFEEFYAGWNYLAFEDEYGGTYYGYGHIDPAEFVASIREYLGKECGFTTEELAEYDDDPLVQDVEHRYAVTVEPAIGPDGWHISWKGVEENTFNSFPVTVLYL